MEAIGTDKMPRQIKNSSLLVKLLRDPRFVAGVNKAIEITQKTKLHYETAFSIDRVKDTSRLVYPITIEVGDKNSVGGELNSAGWERIEEEFERVYGRKHQGLRDKEFDAFVDKMTSDGEGPEENYPIDEDGLDTVLRVEAADCVTFLDFHTHPVAYAYPSRRDFEVVKFNYGAQKDARVVGMVVAAYPTTKNSGKHAFSVYHGDPISFEEFHLSQVFGAPLGSNTRLVNGVFFADKGKFMFHRLQDRGARKFRAAKEALKVFDNLS